MAKPQQQRAPFVAYYRVSTQRQGQSGLGLDAQKAAVIHYLRTVRGFLAGEFTEIETGKGSNALERRPRLRQALDECRAKSATLVIAKLDRLARNVHFISGLMETKVAFVACESPNDGPLVLHIKAAIAEEESKKISVRTKEALAQAKARGVKLGRAGKRNLRPYLKKRERNAEAFALRLKGQVEGFRLRGLSQRGMVKELNDIGVAAPRGGKWSLIQLQRALARM